MVTSKKTDNISQTVSNASYTYDKVGNCTKSVEDELQHVVRIIV